MYAYIKVSNKAYIEMKFKKSSSTLTNENALKLVFLNSAFGALRFIYDPFTWNYSESIIRLRNRSALTKKY